jgi:hypothetical protein
MVRNLSGMRAGLSCRDVVGEVFTIALLVTMAYFGACVITPWQWKVFYLLAPAAKPAWLPCPTGEVVTVLHRKIDAETWLEIVGTISFLLTFTSFFGLWWLILKRWRQNQR